MEAANLPFPPVSEVVSPMAPPSTLSQIVWTDLTGGAVLPMSRAEAIRVPAVARLRHITAGTVARCPLTVWRGAAQLTEDQEPSWVSRTDVGGLPPYHRMLWTVDDLIFNGWSLWATLRGGQLLAANRIPPERWTFQPDGTIHVGDRPMASHEVILIPGPHEGICNFGQGAIREARDLSSAAAEAARNPAAYLNLHYTGDTPMTEDEIDALIARWTAARKGLNGGVSFTGKNVEAKEMGSHESHLLIEGRNAAAVDMARLISAPAAMTDATNAGASLTYETTQGRNAEFLDYGAQLYMDAIAARLSMDDVVPHGQSVRFDTSQLRDPMPSATGPVTED